MAEGTESWWDRVKQWTCDHLDWHNGRGANVGFDGASLTARCSQCNRRVLMDSQGNWFSAYVQQDAE